MHISKSILFASAAAFAIVPAANGQSTNKWEKSASLGLSLTSGNSDTLMLTGDILAARKWDAEEINLGASISYGEIEDVKSNESARGFGQWNHLFTDRFYSYVRAEALHDAI